MAKKKDQRHFYMLHFITNAKYDASRIFNGTIITARSKLIVSMLNEIEQNCVENN